MSAELLRELEALAARWEGWANAKCRDAQLEPTEFGRRFITNGEICYRNCVRELRALLTQQTESTITLTVPPGCSVYVTVKSIADDPESVAAGVARKEFHVHVT